MFIPLRPSQVSGHDGGTGASPISSIKHAGGPVEMGLAEVHQVLTRNELRERVAVRVDGGMRNGRDVLVSSEQHKLEQHAGLLCDCNERLRK